jgi:hypothetical protein
MERVGGEGGGSKYFLAMCKGIGFQMNDLVDIFVGTGKGVTGNKAFPIKARIKGVKVEKGEERFLCSPIVGCQKGRCPSFPPEGQGVWERCVWGAKAPLLFEAECRSAREVFSPSPDPSPCVLILNYPLASHSRPSLLLH